MTEVMRRYTFKLYPTREQAAALHEQRMMMADLWNALLQRREDVYRRERRTLTRFDLEYEITALYRECPEWRALSTWSGRRVNYSLDLAFQAFFRRAKQGAGAQSGYPRYKRRKDYQRIPHRCASGCRLVPAPRERSDGRKTAGSARNWALTLKGVLEPIHARGKYPSWPIDHKDADVIWDGRNWWLSICVEMEPERLAGDNPLTIEMACIDGLARVNGDLWDPPQLTALQAMQDHVDALKSARDKRWPKRAPADAEWRDANEEISRLSSKIARARRDVLHVWTARIVHLASDITVITPPVKEQTQSPRGDEREWGAAVETVSALNRSVLSRAPATAVAMLQYKAAEAGIRCDVVTAEASEIAVGKKLVETGRTIRRISRKARREANVETGISNRASGDQQGGFPARPLG